MLKALNLEALQGDVEDRVSTSCSPYQLSALKLVCMKRKVMAGSGASVTVAPAASFACKRATVGRYSDFNITSRR